MTPIEFMTQFGTSILAPILVYLKVRDERRTTGQSRDTEIALLTKRMDSVETSLNEIAELRATIGRLENAITRLGTIIEMHVK